TRKQAAIRSGINPKHFNYVVQQEPFSSYLIEDKKFQWLVNSEIIPKIKDYYKSHKEAFHYYNDHPDYLISYRIAPILNKTNQELLTEIQQGKWDNMIEKVPRISPSNTSYG